MNFLKTNVNSTKKLELNKFLNDFLTKNIDWLDLRRNVGVNIFQKHHKSISNTLNIKKTGNAALGSSLFFQKRRYFTAQWQKMLREMDTKKTQTITEHKSQEIWK